MRPVFHLTGASEDAPGSKSVVAKAAHTRLDLCNYTGHFDFGLYFFNEDL